VTMGRVAKAGHTVVSSAARDDALTRASARSNVHASQRSSEAALRPQSRCAYVDKDAASTIPALLVSESGGFRERRRSPTTLEPATSHAPRSHVVSAIWEITRERQRVGIWGGSDGPSGASDTFSGTTSVSAPAMRRKKSFSEARRESTPCPEMGNGALPSDVDACRERVGRTGVVGAVLWLCGWSVSEDVHGNASDVDELCKQVRREDDVAVGGELSGGRNMRKKCTTGPAAKTRTKAFDGGTPQRVHGLHGAAQMRRTFSVP